MPTILMLMPKMTTVQQNLETCTINKPVTGYEQSRDASATLQDALSFLTDKGLDISAVSSEIDGKFMSAFIRARKPAA